MHKEQLYGVIAKWNLHLQGQSISVQVLLGTSSKTPELLPPSPTACELPKWGICLAAVFHGPLPRQFLCA